MDTGKVVKWVLIVIAIYFVWNWIQNNVGGPSIGGSAEVYPAPYAAPLVGPSGVYGWSPYWYNRGRRSTGAARRGPSRRPTPQTGAWVGGR